MILRRLVALAAILAAAGALQAQPLRAPVQPAAPVAPPPAAALQTAQPEKPTNGILAQVNTHVITVDDVLREVSPLLESLRAQARSQQEYNAKFEEISNDAILELVDRQLLIDAFRTPKEGQKDVPKVPESYIKSVINDRITQSFDDDRLKFHAWLQKRGQTPADFAREVEESIIVDFMRNQQQKSRSIISPAKIEQYYNENKERFFEPEKVQFRLIQLDRNGASDDELRARVQELIDRVNKGEKFEDIAKQHSTDSSRARGGEFPTQEITNINEDFRNPIFNSKPGGLQKGEMTPPILLQQGGYVLYIVDRTKAGIPPIEDVRGEIEQILALQMTNIDAERYMERLRKKAFIKFF